MQNSSDLTQQIDAELEAAAKALCEIERGFDAWDEYTTGRERKGYRRRAWAVIGAYLEAQSPDFG